MTASLLPAAVASPTTRATTSIARHPIAAFFGLAFVWSWTVAWIEPFVPGGAGPAFQFGPPLAALLVSGIVDPSTTHRAQMPRPLVFVVAALVAFVVWLSFFTVVVVTDRTPAFFMNGAAVAAMAGVVISGVVSRRRGVRALLESLVRSGVGRRWYLVALVLLPATFLLGAVGAIGLGETLPPYPYASPSPAWLLALAWIALYGGGMEETGWRGFALPRLQQRHSPLVASLMLSCVWAAWHTPEYFNGFYTGAAAGSAVGGAILVRFLLMTPPLAILMTWAYNGARGSLLLVVLMHAAYNTASALLPLSSDAYALAFLVQWVVAISVVVGARMWRRTPAGLTGAPVLWAAIGQPVPASMAVDRSQEDGLGQIPRLGRQLVRPAARRRVAAASR